MASLQSRTTPVLTPVEPTSIQPGGGLCMSLELAWGRLRRAWLRRFRPGYVRRMTGKRQGHCPNCPHDIIDSRDLKFYRNVCGYWVPEHDDPFRWRDRIRLARVGLAEVVCFSLLFLTISLPLGFAAISFHPAFWVPLGLVLSLWIFVISFFRDPRRTIPTNPAVLVSPADGTVTHVGEVDEPDFPGGRAFCISIFLSVFNVHVNRVPRTGRVVRVRYFPGRFLDARHPECGVRNEQLWVDLEESNPPRQIRIKQIAGAIARRIVCCLKPGERVYAGDRFGMIKFGSRTEVLLPVDETMEGVVKVGDQVKGGTTILLHFRGLGSAKEGAGG
jgi:phosphatidylserine decarboxylase